MKKAPAWAAGTLIGPIIPHGSRESHVQSAGQAKNRPDDEKTGKMMSLKTPAVILENVWCQSRYSNDRFLCPRSIYSWWREVWLERSGVTVRV